MRHAARRPSLPVILITALLLPLIAVVAAPPAPARAATESQGYLELSDGTHLRYSLLLPDGDGPFPAVVQYAGYNNGNNPKDGTFGKMVDRVVGAGIAVLGVSMRGTGCSEGTFHPFTTQWGRDGAEVIDWISRQPWNDGNVAMAGVSYPAIGALVTAVQQPPALKAVIADVPVVDLYRNVAYPGGIWNATFSTVWTGLQKYGTLYGLEEVAGEGDTACAAAMPFQNDPTDITGVQAATHPYIDSLDRYTDFLQPEDLAAIEAPTLVYTAWQDEQLGSRAMHAYRFLDPDHRWIVASNGDHIGFAGSKWNQDLSLRFLEHFLRGGTADDFDAPAVQIARDVRKGDASFDALDTYGTYPVPTVRTTLYPQLDGSLRRSPATDTGSLDLDAPLPAPSMPVGIDVGAGVNPEVYSEAYKVPVPPNGAVSFTTPPLANDLQVDGPLSLDLVVSSTSTDADLQVSLTEVRPDDQELYVQRGWLRASHRKLDERRSTPTLPVHTHLAADAEPLVPGQPTPLRIEIWPVDHVFRAGSSLRVTVESPVGFTGFRQLAFDPGPAVHTIHLGPDTPARLVFGRIARPHVTTPRPACDTLINMPCRDNQTPVPDGQLRVGGGPPHRNLPAR